MKKPHLLITPGDPEGIGPEVTVKALKALDFCRKLGRISLVGSAEALLRAGLDTRRDLSIISCPRANPSPGYVSGWAVQEATQLVLKGQASALVTGPISKARLQKAGFPYQGHTDFIAALCEGRKKARKPATMMLANAKLRVSLVTVHVPLSRVSRLITRESLTKTIQDTIDALKGGFGISRPTVAVLGLNPHAGEGGILGKEEGRVIIPTLTSLKKKYGSRCTILGPFPSDTFFTKDLRAFDAVVAMYHDQGLIPIKSIDFANTINISLGLPIIRTSVDHGVAFDIAGKGVADPTSMVRAIETAFTWSSIRARSVGRVLIRK